ncbi:flippase [Pseudobutyrivibrio ruminis]|uniref:flippase n=1 Tax=Pseudobutyrivibrio ruminis TaxID=46206 RepID=UPI0004264CAB|nr:flippase [Pseudobutyrivibrio ruminis]
MEKKSSIKKNFIYNLIYNILNIIVPLISAPYTSRVLGVDKIGIYSYTYSLISTVIMIGAMGTATYGQKEIAASKDAEERSTLFWEIFVIKGVTTILCAALFMVYALNDNYAFYYLIQIPFFIAAVLDVSWLFQGLEKFNYIAIRNSLVRIAGIILLFIIVKSPSDLWKYLLIICGSQLVGNLSMWPYVPRYVHRFSFSKKRIVYHIKNMMVYFVPSVTYQIYAVLDKAMLGWLVGSDYENGYYEQAHKIVNMAVSIISAFTIVMRSRMSYLYSIKDYKEIERKLYQACNTMAFMVFPMSFGLALIAAGMVPWFFGDGYDKVISLLYVFCPFFAFMGYSRLIGTHILTPSGRQGKSNVAQCFAAVCNLILNLLLIPKFYAFGAAIASVGAEFVIVVIYYYAIRKELSLVTVAKTGWKKLLSAAVMFAVLFPLTKRLPISILSSVLEVVLGSCIYVVFLFIIRDEFLLINYQQIKKKYFEKFFKKN